MKVFFGRVALIATIVLGAMLQGGCSSVSKASQQRDFDKQTGVLIQHMKALQAKGDPLGDYYYALANSDGWLKEVTDPKAITQLFEQAAAKGSMDAKILLALQEAMDEPIPGQLDLHQGPGRDLTQWERGLAQLLPLLQQQCSARRLVLDMGKPRVRYYSIAYKVWPTFRDGYYRYNSDGSRILLRDSERQKDWEDLDNRCPTPQNQWLYP